MQEIVIGTEELVVAIIIFVALVIWSWKSK